MILIQNVWKSLNGIIKFFNKIKNKNKVTLIWLLSNKMRFRCNLKHIYALIYFVWYKLWRKPYQMWCMTLFCNKLYVYACTFYKCVTLSFTNIQDVLKLRSLLFNKPYQKTKHFSSKWHLKVFESIYVDLIIK